VGRALFEKRALPTPLSSKPFEELRKGRGVVLRKPPLSPCTPSLRNLLEQQKKTDEPLDTVYPSFSVQTLRV